MAEHIDGKAKHLGGKIKEGVGELLGDSQMEREGELEQVEGRAEQERERALESATEAEVRRQAARRAQGEGI